MRVLELFSGENASFSTVARELGHEAVTLDNRAKCAADIQESILTWDYMMFEADAFDVVWASCPCDQMSQLRNKPGDLEGAEEIVRRTLEICYYFECGGASVFIENPINALPRLPLMRPFQEFLKTITYCSYSAPGDEFFYQKKTGIYDMCGSAWAPRPLCGRDCGGCVGGRHIVWARHGHGAVRRAECDAAGLKSNYTTAQLHRVPKLLCMEILLSLQ